MLSSDESTGLSVGLVMGEAAGTQTARKAQSPSRQSDSSAQAILLSILDPQSLPHSPLSQSTSDWQSQPSPKSPNSCVHWCAMHAPTAQSASVSQERQVMISPSVIARIGSSITIRKRSVFMVSKMERVVLYFKKHQKM
jgi:hypothetical protein